MKTLFNEIFYAIRGRCISDESASVAAAEVAELVGKKITPDRSTHKHKWEPVGVAAKKISS